MSITASLRNILRKLPTTFATLVLVVAIISQHARGQEYQGNIGNHPTDGAVMVIYDSSGSMWGRVDNRPKYEIAQENFAHMIDQFGADRLDLDLGLTVFGHRIKGNCDDIEQILAPRSLDEQKHRQQLKTEVRRLLPKGITPISKALGFAAEALKYSEQRATVILISDGIEECRGDPCAMAEKLKRLGVGFTAHLVGFDLSQEDFEKLRCVADLTGGEALLANDAATLSSALKRLNQQIRREREARRQEDTHVDPIMAGGLGQLSLRTGTVAPDVFTEIDPPVAFEIYQLNGDAQRLVVRDQGGYEGAFPAGTYRIIALQGNARKESEIEIPAGGSMSVEMLFGPGWILGHVIDADGRQQRSRIIQWTIQRIENGQPVGDPQQHQGSELDVSVPPGRYQIEAKMGGSRNDTPKIVDVTAERETTVEIELWTPE